jgi:hypothetical protein
MKSTASCKGALIGLDCTAGFAVTPARLRIDLNGARRFRLDPGGAGGKEQWHNPQVTFPDSIQVPGCWLAVWGFAYREIRWACFPDSTPAAHPEAVFLCDRMLRYRDSGEFRPEAEITAVQLSNEAAEYLRQH